MFNLTKKYKIFIVTFMVFSIITVTLFYNVLKPSKTLPIYNPADVNPELVDSTAQYIAKGHKIANFSFINQNGKTITQKDYEGKIYVADFFFTTCGSICPIMTTNMVDQKRHRLEQRFNLIVVFFYCLLIFFLPISIALVESMAGFVVLFFVMLNLVHK
jgi:cytochrome oxidase Cu insertion factor (SCO1/SenC/PrrC family)